MKLDPSIKRKLDSLPRQPGVYMFREAKGRVIYVGKANDLRSRVGQYFTGADERPQIPFMMAKQTGFEFIVASNEVESLLLENNLIKKHHPPFNIALRDDKSYAFIKIDHATQIPQIYVTRNNAEPNARYFGPYSSSFKVRETLHLVRKIFPYCANSKVTDRPCFYYHLHRCPGVCFGKISLEEYGAYIKEIELFLAGNIGKVQALLKTQMREASTRHQFERAAGLRDQLNAITVVRERQRAIFASRANWDFVSLFPTIDKTAVNVFAIRDGHLNDRKNFIMENTAKQAEADVLGAFMQTYYAAAQEDQPREVYVPVQPTDAAILKKLFARSVSFTVPTRGKKKELLALGRENGREYFEQWSMEQASEVSKASISLDELQKVLHLPQPPHRIECFDISNIQGTNSVASMVVVEAGKPKKSEYRKFKIKIDGSPDDFAMMREALTRRFARSATASADGTTWLLPDLLVVDGGKGQLGIAVEVLHEFNLNIPVIGLAKREEEIFVPGSSGPILLPKSNYALQLLQRLRDEAHRFAITFHRSLRSKKAYVGALDTIPGVGPAKKKLLIKKFGSVAGVRRASVEEIADVVGKVLAEKISKVL